MASSTAEPWSTTTNAPGAVAPARPYLPPYFRGGPPSSTLSPGHQDILDMHANSLPNALIYILVVMVLYILAMTIVVIKYIRSERYEARLTRLFQNFMQREHFFRLSRRRSSLPKCPPDPPLPLSSSPPTEQPPDPPPPEDESKV